MFFFSILKVDLFVNAWYVEKLLLFLYRLCPVQDLSRNFQKKMAWRAHTMWHVDFLSNHSHSWHLEEKKLTKMKTKFVLDFKHLLISCMCFKLLSCSLKRDGFLKTCHGKYGCFSVDYPWFSSHRVVNALPRQV